MVALETAMQNTVHVVINRKNDSKQCVFCQEVTLKVILMAYLWHKMVD